MPRQAHGRTQSERSRTLAAGRPSRAVSKKKNGRDRHMKEGAGEEFERA